MNSLPLVLLLGTSLLTGCASRSAVSTREPYVKPGLIMLTADQAARRGDLILALPPAPAARTGEPRDTSAVLTAAPVRAYTLGRRVDPADRELMHEEHVVYRRESAPRWRMDVPADQKIMVGPRITDGRQDMQPLLTKELTTYLADQRRALESNQRAIEALFQAVEALNRRPQPNPSSGGEPPSQPRTEPEPEATEPKPADHPLGPKVKTFDDGQ